MIWTAPHIPASAPAWNDAEWIQQTNAAFKSYHSVLALARAPLADSELVRPLLVLDDRSPTATERGQALRLVLRWAVAQLAPERPRYPVGSHRPLDDPTWQNPLWWRYNILRHRYVEPLHPDEFVEGARITETLLARMGIPSPDTYFDERNRAVREVAQWLIQQLREGGATAELRALALEEACAPLQREPAAAHLLDLAAVFGQTLHPNESAGAELSSVPETGSQTPGSGADSTNDAGAALDEEAVFPHVLLLELARYEQMADISAGLAWLIRRRYVQAGEDNRNLWMSPVLQTYLYARQDVRLRRSRHSRIARYFEAAHEPLHAARHHLLAGDQAHAADLVLATLPDLDDGAALDEMAALLRRFAPADSAPHARLAPAVWSELQIRLADLEATRGARLAALAACRQGLQTDDPQEIPPRNQARIYRRMGKLYEKHNQLHALGYYDQAAALFAEDDPEVMTLLKDRGWLHILRQTWTQAEADLRRALILADQRAADQGATEQSEAHLAALQADIHDALASLYRHQKDFDKAIDFARRALHERERVGDLLRVAHSFNNLGLIYNELGDYRHAIAAFEEARASFERLGNQELIAGAHLNIGLAHHLDHRLPAAIEAYQACLALCQVIDLPLVQSRAHANLVEAYLEQGAVRAAADHWQQGLALSRAAGFDDEIAYYADLRANSAQLAAQTQLPAPFESTAHPADRISLSSPQTAVTPRPAFAEETNLPDSATEIDSRWTGLDPDRRAVVKLVQAEGRVTPRRLMSILNVSKATATRRLAALVEQEILIRHGEGRGVCYTLPPTPSAPPVDSMGSDAMAGELVQVWRDQLAAYSTQLVDTFGVVRLATDTDAVQSGPGGAQPAGRWFADFARTPDLELFFALEAQLGEWLGAPVDLKPARYAHGLSSCVTVWRAVLERG